ncbi:hypothetical protein ACVIHF_008748 [Bradyrhizobium sp. USDA 4506]
MNKITSDHLSRSAYVYVRQSTRTNSSIILRAVGVSTRSQLAHSCLAGKTSSSSMMTLVARGAAQRVPALSAC